jgi:hypothetical protein
MLNMEERNAREISLRNVIYILAQLIVSSHLGEIVARIVDLEFVIAQFLSMRNRMEQNARDL